MKNKKHIFSWVIQQAANGWDKFGRNSFDFIDRLRKTGDAAGHKTDPCGAGNDRLFCPTGTGPQDITTRLKHCNLQCFRLLPRTKQRYLRCFLFLEPQKLSQNTAICDTLATQHVRNAVF